MWNVFMHHVSRRFRDFVPPVFISAVGVLLLIPLQVDVEEGLTLFVAALLLLLHEELSRSPWSRILVAAALGFGFFAFGILFAVWKYTLPGIPEQAKSFMKLVTFSLILCGVANGTLHTEGFWQHMQLVWLQTRFFLVELWRLQWSPPAESVFSLQGVVSSIPVGKMVFIGAMAFGVLIVFSMHWLEVSICQICRENPVDIECTDCKKKGKGFSRMCCQCHRTQEAFGRHPDSQGVSRLWQRSLSGSLFLLGVYCLLLSPKLSFFKVRGLFAFVVVRALGFLWQMFQWWRLPEEGSQEARHLRGLMMRAGANWMMNAKQN
eukprot:GGOE01002339.1.p1 GENE.GGOE01002339.1~~GGOE01002339.1.p1  ORF type:complete len:320 (+),score=42.73 GGOE01002339.1:113-1072(+)